MDSVGQFLAHAGPRPLWMRSLQKVHLLAGPVSWLNDTTPNGHELTQYRQPLHTSWLMFTVPYSVRGIAPVGHASRQPAWAQCLQTSDIRSHCSSPFACGFSMKRTRREGLSVNWAWFWEAPVHSGSSI